MKFICVVLFLMLLQLFGHGTSTSNINMDGVNVTGIALLRFNANLKPSTRNCRDHMWELCSKDAVPPELSYAAVKAGRDSNGYTIFIGRANYSGDLLPAKIIPDKRVFNVSTGGKDIPVNDFEVLSGWSDVYKWIPSSNGDVPYGAVKCGRTSDGEILYCGRANAVEGGQTVGKVHPSQGGLYISNDGQEVKLTEYEILVQPDPWISTAWGYVYIFSLQGGFDEDGDAIFVGRVNKDGNIIPAKVIPNKGGAFYSWSGREHKANSYEVLVGRGFCWIVSGNGNIPDNAVPAGNTSAGETLYVGRAEHDGSLTIGTVYQSQHFLYMAFGGQEVRKESYEILVRI